MSGVKFGKFEDLKKNRGKLGAEMVKKAKELSADKGYPVDTRFWKPTYDSSGTAKARIRFMPPPPNEESAVIKFYTHFFRGPGGVYAENCLTTLKQDDPVHKHARALWNTKDPAKEELARNIGRKEQYIANIYVIKDPGNPEAENKVWLWKFPKSVMKMLETAMTGDVAGDAELGVKNTEAFEVFNFYGARDFMVSLYKKGTFPNYERCKFIDAAYDLFESDKTAEAVWNGLYSLDALVDPKNFKSYEVLEDLFCRVMGVRTVSQLDSVSAKPDLPGEEEKTEEEPSLSRPSPRTTGASLRVDTAADEGEEPDDDSYLSRMIARR